MSRLRQIAAVAVCAALLVTVGGPSALAKQPLPPKGAGGPEIQPFNTARFDLRGFVKVDGITVDLSGEGLLAPPDRSSGTFKLGPITLETVVVRPSVYARTRFDPEWEASEIPAELPFVVSPATGSDFLALGPYSLAGQERIDGRLTTRWSADMDLSGLAELMSLLPTEDVGDILRTLRGSMDVWVGNDDRLLYRERLLMTMIVPAIEPDGDPLPATLDITTTYSRHNQPVSIQAPDAAPRPLPTLPLFPRLRAGYTGIMKALIREPVPAASPA